MIQTAQTFSADQINTFLIVIGGMVLANVGHIGSSLVRNYRRKIKVETALKAAHDKIRELTKRVERLEGEK